MKALDSNAFDLIQSDFVIDSVVKLRRSRRFMAGNGLRILNRAAIFKVCGNSGGAKRVATSGGRKPGGSDAPLYHSEVIGAAHPLFGKIRSFSPAGPEE